MAKTVTIQALVEPAVKARLERLAALKGSSASALAREFITKELPIEEAKFDSAQAVAAGLAQAGILAPGKEDELLRMIRRNLHVFEGGDNEDS